MYDEIAEKILDLIDEETDAAAYPEFSGEGYKPYKIDAKNFHEISKSNSLKKIAFVDGGNAEIMGAANFSLNLMRLCCVVYKNNKKILTKKSEFFAFVHSIKQGGEIHYKTSFFNISNPIGLQDVAFSSFDHTLMLGVNRAGIGSVANAIRRFAELRLAKSIADEKIADIIVLDGNLQSTLTNENKYLEELYESCYKNKVILTALGKTSSLFTDNGNLLGVVLNNISNISSWFYYPIVEIDNPNHKAEMYFAKFHDKSKYVFRFEVFNKQKDKAKETISGLAGNCADPIFIGYPYGLIEADRVARVGNSEKESLRTMMLVKLKSKNIGKYLNSANAHEILDRVSF